MDIEQYASDALVVHGGGLTPDEQLPQKVIQRMDTAIAAWEDGFAPNVVLSGGHSFMVDTPPDVSEAAVMKQYALRQGISEGVIHLEERSLDTIGNALFTKLDLAVPNNWERLLVVTSRSHLPRLMGIFQHVLGKDIEVRGIPAPEHVTVKEKVYEQLGAAMMREVLRGTKPGDDAAIRERLFDLVPGYANGTKGRLAIRSLSGLLRAGGVL